MKVTVNKNTPLQIKKNKFKLILLLPHTQKTYKGIETRFVPGDTEMSIIRSAIDKAAIHPTVVECWHGPVNNKVINS